MNRLRRMGKQSNENIDKSDKPDVEAQAAANGSPQVAEGFADESSSIDSEMAIDNGSTEWSEEHTLDATPDVSKDGSATDDSESGHSEQVGEVSLLGSDETVEAATEPTGMADQELGSDGQNAHTEEDYLEEAAL